MVSIVWLTARLASRNAHGIGLGNRDARDRIVKERKSSRGTTWLTIPAAQRLVGADRILG